MTFDHEPPLSFSYYGEPLSLAAFYPGGLFVKDLCLWERGFEESVIRLSVKRQFERLPKPVVGTRLETKFFNLPILFFASISIYATSPHSPSLFTTICPH